MALNEILSKLNKVKSCGNGEYTALCPAHNDTNPSLSVCEKEGKILLHCHKGCSSGDIVAALGMEMKELFCDSTALSRQRVEPQRSHIYRNEDGSCFARKHIFTDPVKGKYACWELYNNGGYTKGLCGKKPPLYALPELIEARGNIYIAEGEKDVETLQKMGLCATTSPKGAGGKWEADYNKYLEGRDIVIISDNDEAGKIYADNVKAAVLPVAKSVMHIPAKRLYPDLESKGDISDVAEFLGIERTRELIVSAVAEGKAVSYRALPGFFYYSNRGVLRVDRAELAEYIRAREHYLFERGADDNVVRRLIYRDGVYRSVSLDEIKNIVKGYIMEYAPTAVRMADVEEVTKNLLTDSCFVSSDQLNCDENIINFKNGLLRLDTMTLVPHDPRVYSTVQLDCDYTDEEEPTPVFDRFLADICEEDSDKIKLLTEYMGVALSNIYAYRMKSALFMVGKGNTGKSQLKALCERLLGQSNCASIDLSTIESRFGTSAIYGKRLSGSSDLSYMSISELKVFKQITGGDRIFAEIKGSAPFYYTYRGVLWFCMNSLPKFGGDRGSWVYDRIMVFECNNVISPEKQDKMICDKMYRERNGIIYKCIKALKRVIENNYKYTLPLAARCSGARYMESNNPIKSFFGQCCTPFGGSKQGFEMTTTAMHRVFVRWCKDNEPGYKASLSEFKKQLAEGFGVDVEKITKHTRNGTCFLFGLNKEGYDNYYLPYIKANNSYK